MTPLEEKQFWKGHSIVSPYTAAAQIPTDTKTYKFPPTAPTTQFSDGLNGTRALEQDPSGGSLNEPGKKADAGKNLPWLFQTGFANALHEVSRVTTLGARKYTPGGWATVPDGSNRYMEAFARHTGELAKGHVFDDGPTGLGADIYHKASMIWNLLASLELDIRESKK